MADKMWMGIPGRHMQWVPCPLIGSTISHKRYVEQIRFENGGGDARRSQQYQTEYNFSFSGPSHELDGIDAFNRFASGYYGDGLIYAAHPVVLETNMFSAAWASPGLIEEGWKNIYSVAPTFTNTVANSYSQPQRTANFNITTTANVPVKTFTIPVPDGYTLHVGASGVATGTAAVRARPVNADGTYGTIVTVQLNAPDAATRFGTTISGCVAVEIFLTRTDSSVSTLALTSMIAQVYKTGSSPSLPTSHVFGQGSTGMMFVDDAVVETYSYMHPPRSGISTTLVEVEAWR